LTSSIANFEYRYESGALDESYADIFAILISNFHKKVENWDWRIGNGFGEEDCAFRNLQQPSSCNSTFTINGERRQINHPEHMNDFLDLPYNQDRGGIHHNCSIHNHAAYKLLTSQMK
ncbi:MAG: M4 family metallopeptidase, partial [Deinococcota bacterium]